MRRLLYQIRIILAVAFFWCCRARAEPTEFHVPAQSADAALLSFSRQAKLEVLYSADDLQEVQSNPVEGRFEPPDAVSQLLEGTGFAAHRGFRGKFIITRVRLPTGSLNGHLLMADGSPARNVRVTILQARRGAVTDEGGAFHLTSLAPGVYQLVATGAGLQPLEVDNVKIEANRALTLQPQTIQRASEPGQLDPFIIEARPVKSALFDGADPSLAVRTATGNIDLPRTENDALPYTIFDRDQIARSGVVDLNELLQRELLDSNASARAPEQDETQQSFIAGSTNVSLRGYEPDETIVLVNGRRLPEILTSGGRNTPPPDVNFIPLSLVQEIQVLPVSASALYTGNPVGGVINIVLRPVMEARATEVTATYTNALAGFDAPQKAISLLHGETLLHGKLHFRFNASFTQAQPATESELKHHQEHDNRNLPLDASIYRATPNIRSANGTPLFGPGTSSVTSVPPGTSGSVDLSAFATRDGVRNFDFFNSPGELAASLDSLDYPYGRRQTRSTYYGSIVYDIAPWLELGFDGTFSRTVVNRGLDVFNADLKLKADSPFNPFKQDVIVSLNETASKLGENYSEAQLEFASALFGILLKLPADWRISLDAQYAHNLAKYRGLSAADPQRWQAAVDAGLYNPLRDTQRGETPEVFYNNIVSYRGGKNRFVTVGDYDALDVAFRVTDQSLVLPTGFANVEAGVDYRLNRLAKYLDESRYADGSLAYDPIHWDGRTLQRYSFFGELRAPLLPEKWLTGRVRKVEVELAGRYIAADNAEANFAPTFGLKLDFAGGFAFRASVTDSNRFPTPLMSHRVVLPTGSQGIGDENVLIYDPRRNERYNVIAKDLLDPALRPEAAVTQSAGLIYQHGRERRIRLSIDYVDTRKTNELITLYAQDLLNLEDLFPGRVIRGSPKAGESPGQARVSSVLTGTTNISWRHSENWNAAATFAWDKCWGGTFDLYMRLLYFPKYERQVFPKSPTIDEVRDPDVANLGLLEYRSNFGAGWSNRNFGFGVDGHYYHSRVLPLIERISQGGSAIPAFTQFDVYAQSDLTRLIPWKKPGFGLSGQLRINNVLDSAFPRYADDPSGAGVQPYGDWRGRVYSLSVTATF